MTDRKYCEDCQFCFVPPSGLGFARCMAPGAIKQKDGDMFVSRKFEADQHRFASSTRLDDAMCGAEAKWFAVKTDEAAA